MNRRVGRRGEKKGGRDSLRRARSGDGCARSLDAPKARGLHAHYTTQSARANHAVACADVTQHETIARVSACAT